MPATVLPSTTVLVRTAPMKAATRALTEAVRGAYMVRSFREAVFVVDVRTVGSRGGHRERIATGRENRGVNCVRNFVAPARAGAVHPRQRQFIARSCISRRDCTRFAPAPADATKSGPNGGAARLLDRGARRWRAMRRRSAADGSS
jgi:hypothetical protein